MKNPTRLHVLIVALAALALRIPLMDNPIWYDESFTLLLARLPFAEMIQATAGDVHPPMWYAIEWMFYRLFPSLPDWGTRIPALAFGLLGLDALNGLASRLGLPAPARWAALIIMALAPFQIQYSTEGRMYTWLQWLVMMGANAVLDKRYARAGLFTVLMAYTQNWGVFYGVGLGALALLNAPRDWRRWLGAFAGAGAAWLPWAAVISRQMSDIDGNYWIYRYSFAATWDYVMRMVWGNTTTWPITYAVSATLLLMAFVVATRSYTKPIRLAALVAVPLAIGQFISWVYQPVIIPRAMIGTAPALYLLMSSLAPYITRRRAMFVGVFLLPVIMLAYGQVYTFPYKINAPYLDHIPLRPGDAVLMTVDPLQQMASRPDVPVHVLDVPDCRSPFGALTAQTRTALGYTARPLEQISAPRLWVVWQPLPLAADCEREYMFATFGAPAIHLPEIEHVPGTDYYIWEYVP